MSTINCFQLRAPEPCLTSTVTLTHTLAPSPGGRKVLGRGDCSVHRVRHGSAQGAHSTAAKGNGDGGVLWPPPPHCATSVATQRLMHIPPPPYACCPPLPLPFTQTNHPFTRCHALVTLLHCPPSSCAPGKQVNMWFLPYMHAKKKLKKRRFKIVVRAWAPLCPRHVLLRAPLLGVWAWPCPRPPGLPPLPGPVGML